MATLNTGQSQLKRLERRRNLADALTQQAISTQPIIHPLQGAAKLVQALTANAINRKTSKTEDEIEKQQRQFLADMLKPNQTTVTDTVPFQPSAEQRKAIIDRVGDPSQLQGFPEQQALLQQEVDRQLNLLGRGNEQQRNQIVSQVGDPSQLAQFPEQQAMLQQLIDERIAQLPQRTMQQERIVETPKTTNQLLEALIQANPALGQSILGNVVQDRLLGQKEPSTDDIKEYQFAVEQGYQGSLVDWLDRSNNLTGGRNADGAPNGYRWDKRGNLEYIPGGPADPNLAKNTAENSAKATLLENSATAMTELKALMFDADGTVNRTTLLNMNVPGGGTPFTNGRVANVLIKEAIEAKLRAESGAAVPESEVKRAAERFRPSNFDDDETIALKLSLLDRFVNNAFDRMNKDGRFSVKRTVDALLEQPLKVEQPKYKIGQTANGGTLIYTENGWVENR